MNRRSALFLAALAGGLVPSRLLAQDRNGSSRGDDFYRRAGAGSLRLAQDDRERFADEALIPDDGLIPDDDVGELLPPGDGGLPAGFPVESGQSARTFDITRYTALPHIDNEPQRALVDWIFRVTGSAAWHGDRVAALSASRSRLLAYNEARILKQVEDVVARFVDAESDILNIRVRFIAAEDTRWRYAVASRLSSIGSGPQGQQIWALGVEDAALVLTQMQISQGFKLLADQNVRMVNGQTLSVERVMEVSYVSGPQRDSTLGLGFQPATAKLQEGVKLRLSPLLAYAGDSIDVALDLQVNTVRALQSTRILTPREVGTPEMTIEVPEVIETRINRTIPARDWKLGQTLVISAGIHPGILQDKRGFLNLRIPGTVPTKTELLVFIDFDTVDAPPPRTARRDR